MLIPAAIVRADQPVSPATEVFKGYDIYASTIVREDTIWKQWFAGWMTESDLPWDACSIHFRKTAVPRSVSGAAMCFPADFIFQCSSDGLSWTDIPGTLQTDYQCADTTTQTFRFESIVSDQYFRLYATKLNADSYGNYYCQIAEMDITLDTTVGIKTSWQSVDSELLQKAKFYRIIPILFIILQPSAIPFRKPQMSAWKYMISLAIGWLIWLMRFR
jgi:hypothetical protein